MSRRSIKAPRHLLIDTIPLLLFLIGAYNPEYINKFKKLSKYRYTIDDFETLRQFLGFTKSVAITPGVLSEISNWLEYDGMHFGDILINTRDLLLRLKEIYILKDKILDSSMVLKLGITDTSLIMAARDHRCSILTRDRILEGVSLNMGLEVYHLDDDILAERDWLGA